ncbi:site-specific DNA-methyltransferase [Mycoplasmopsis arginini]|uniref:site-specific DNA-methyltransferase n=1 Tax=Mycoplasmopsis arginini TaxID=2094 RepID=UPI001CB7A57C|nr:site-specific DNA-methyltransferase [Mycoplasmopsis arginini]
MDPPYNTESSRTDGNNLSEKDNIASSKFIYRDKFSRTGWLNMLNERLIMARQLLKEDGVIFVSIDDSEQAYLKVLMDEIFGEENFVANLVWIKKRGPGGNTSFNYSIVKNTEYILVYAKNINNKIFNYIKHDAEKLNKLGYKFKDKHFEQRGYYKLTDLHHPSSTGSFQYIPSLDYEIKAPDGSLFKLYSNIIKPRSACYTWGYEAYKKGEELGFIECVKNTEGYWVAKRKQYQFVKFNPKTHKIEKIEAGQPFENIIDNIYSQEGGADIINILGDKNAFDFPKPQNLIKYLINMASDNKNARVLDFYAGSGTTGHAVLELNRKDGGNRTFTLVTNNENSIGTNVCYERLYRINKGMGSKGETNFEWIKNNNPFQSNLNVFDIKYFNTSLFNIEEGNKKIKEAYLKELDDFQLNSTNLKTLDILRELTALKPVEKLDGEKYETK